MVGQAPGNLPPNGSANEIPLLKKQVQDHGQKPPNQSLSQKRTEE